MNKSVFAGFAVGTLLSFAAVVGLKQGVLDTPAYANEANTYQQLNLFGDVFERVRADYVEPTDDAKLVENAIKHNIVSQDEPLRIDITFANNRITVSNSLNLRSGRSLDSTGWGHQNLKARYEMVTEAEVSIRQTKELYEVSIPVFPVKMAVRAATA